MRREKEQSMRRDRRVNHAVRTELAHDARLPHADAIAVVAYEGHVTLRGTVGSSAERRAAMATARRAVGVIGVYDELQVRLPNVTNAIRVNPVVLT